MGERSNRASVAVLTPCVPELTTQLQKEISKVADRIIQDLENRGFLSEGEVLLLRDRVNLTIQDLTRLGLVRVLDNNAGTSSSP